MTFTSLLMVFIGLASVVLLTLLFIVVGWHNRLVRLHQRHITDAGMPLCNECRVPWPCPSLQAIGIGE